MLTAAAVGVTLTATGVLGVLGVLDVVIVTLSDLVAVLPAASVTLNPKVLVPALAGFPERTPELDQPRPVLQEPEQDVIDHV